jgi:hypothetical protein
LSHESNYMDEGEVRYQRGRDRDREFMETPDAWPRWPLLPIKRDSPEDGWVQLALLSEVGLNQKRFRIARGACLWDDPVNWAGKWEDVSIDTVLEEGWVVD